MLGPVHQWAGATVNQELAGSNPAAPVSVRDAESQPAQWHHGKDSGEESGRVTVSCS